MHIPAILTLLLMAMPPASDAKPAVAKATVKGAVMFNLEANAGGATKIAFRRGTSITTVTTSRSGTYEVELSPGLYEVSTEDHGFCPVRRAEFELPPSAQVELNLVVIACGIADYVKYDKKGNYKGEFAIHWPPRSYDSFAVKKGKKTRRHLVVLFAVRKEQGAEIQYLKSPPEVKAKYPVRVLITYDLLTIRADEAKLNPKTMEVCAEGSLIVQDGVRTTRPAAIVLRIVEGQAVLQEQNACSPGS